MSGLKKLGRFFRGSWLYGQLCWQLGGFLIWFGIQQYFLSRVLGLSLSWLGLALLLVVSQLMAWNRPNLTPISSGWLLPVSSKIIQDSNQFLFTSAQLDYYCSRVKTAKIQHPSHQGLLINHGWCALAQNQPQAASDIWLEARKTQPNLGY
ncbi:MAG TPA: hypothetical protein DEP87_02660 [Candidatus Pacebacteria bacterium]|nr:hypothetical protein [Candidatus Paceibacterota bacterium]